MTGKTRNHKSRSSFDHQKGFSLIATITLMVLLAVVCLGLLQLSSLSLRGATQQEYVERARSNARLALVMALGQLQKEMGPDQRITAPASLLDNDPTTPDVEGVANPRFTGVWKSAPEVTVENMSAQPQSRQQSFRTWLVSGKDAMNYDFAAQTSMDGNASRTVVGANSVTNTVDQVRVPVIAGPQSGFAWWTSDNGQKATVRASGEDEAKVPTDMASVLASSRRFNQQGYQAADAAMPAGQEVLKKLMDLPTVDLASTASGDKLSRKYFHDLTCQSELVPVDVTSGKLRRCMNLRMAWLENQPVATRQAEGTFGPASGGVDKDYRLFSWDQLRNALNFTQDSTKVTFGPTGRPRITAFKQTGFGGGKEDLEYNPSIIQDRWRIQPVLLKSMFIVSYSTEKVNNAADPTRNLALRLHVYPVVVLWNPYNVDLVVPEYCTGTSAMPMTFDITTANGQLTKVDWRARQTAIYAAFGPECPQGQFANLVIPAGATRVLYPQKFDPANTGYHRHSRFRYDFYFWMKTKNFDCGPNNFGGPFLNLKSGNAVVQTSFSSSLPDEIIGTSGDPVKISVAPSVPTSGLLAYQLAGEHSDWHGNNGTGTDDLPTILRFGLSTAANFQISQNSPQVSVIPDGDVPVRTFGELENTPTPLLIFDCYRKPLDEDIFPSKNWSFSMPSHAIHAGSLDLTGDAITPCYENAYAYRFKAVNSWMEVAQRMQLPPNRDDEAYMGTSYSPAGQLRALSQEIPLVAPISLAQLQHLPLFDYRPAHQDAAADSWGAADRTFDRGRSPEFPQNNAIGNSYASPGIPAGGITEPGWRYSFGYITQSLPMRYDRSYVSNKLLWDAWWCSSIAPQTGPFFTKYGTRRYLVDVAKQFLNDERMLPNEACQKRTQKSTDEVVAELFDAGKVKADADRKLAQFIRINGGFNVNSTSVKAWEQLYAQMFSRKTVVMNSIAGDETPVLMPEEKDKFLVSRYTFIGGGAAERAQGREREDRWWCGCRELTADELRKLAEATVREVKKRGPFLSMADFVNRKLSSDKSLALKGALQSALDDPASGINQPLADKTVTTPYPAYKPTYAFPEAAAGALRQGISGWITQADLLQTIGPVLSPRSDTFTIRAMGEARDKNGNVKATAWCEAVVQRVADYVVPQESADTAAAALTNNANKAFGRKMKVVSFRWLPASEVL